MRLREQIDRRPDNPIQEAILSVEIYIKLIVGVKLGV